MPNPVACVVLDVNEMQKLNNERGYRWGDSFLAELRDLSRASFPDATDIRCSADEVILFLDESDSAELLSRVAAVVCELERALRVGLTFGLGIGKSNYDAKRTAMKSLFKQKQRASNK
jgi:GGDEF domain-containing protein